MPKAQLQYSVNEATIPSLKTTLLSSLQSKNTYYSLNCDKLQEQSFLPNNSAGISR